MNFINDMSTVQKVVLVIAVVTLVVAIVLTLSKKKGEPMKNKVVEKPKKQVNIDPKDIQLTPIHQEPVKRGGYLVMFFAPWCGYCKNLAPVWEELTQNFDGFNGVQITKVNADEDGELAKLHDVRGFPTIKYCPLGVENPTGVVYQGDRSIESIVQFLQENS